jgi:hypothetical protein
MGREVCVCVGGDNGEGGRTAKQGFASRDTRMRLNRKRTLTNVLSSSASSLLLPGASRRWEWLGFTTTYALTSSPRVASGTPAWTCPSIPWVHMVGNLAHLKRHFYARRSLKKKPRKPLHGAR